YTACLAGDVLQRRAKPIDRIGSGLRRSQPGLARKLAEGQTPPLDEQLHRFTRRKAAIGVVQCNHRIESGAGIHTLPGHERHESRSARAYDQVLVTDISWCRCELALNGQAFDHKLPSAIPLSFIRQRYPPEHPTTATHRADLPLGHDLTGWRLDDRSQG